MQVVFSCMRHQIVLVDSTYDADARGGNMSEGVWGTAVLLIATSMDQDEFTHKPKK